MNSLLTTLDEFLAMTPITDRLEISRLASMSSVFAFAQNDGFLEEPESLGDEAKPQACSDAPEDQRPLCAPIAQIMQVLLGLEPEMSLTAQDIANRLGVQPKAVQRVLPSMAIKGRVSREKHLTVHGERDVFSYWLTCEQRERYQRTIQMREASAVAESGPATFEQLKAENSKLRRELDAARSKQRARPSGPAVMGSSVDISSKWHFVQELLERPALASMKLLRDIERDYHYALTRARGAD